MKTLYLDYAATTPCDPGVAQAMQECLTAEGIFGNPASATHEFGRKAAQRVEIARAQLAVLIGANPEEIIFTSGATESNNLAILGLARANADRGRHLVTSRIEHKAVLDPCKRLEKEGWQVTYLEPDHQGRTNPEEVRAALRADTQLVSIMQVNNEIGVINDIAAIGVLCRERGIAFHTDAAQSVGRLEVDVSTLAVDLLSFTAHKLYGPKGIGALYVRNSVRSKLAPILFGGGQERGLRPGTLPVHQIAGFGAACELAARQRAGESRRLQMLTERLWQGLRDLPDIELNGVGALRAPGILNVSFKGAEGESLVSALADVAVSTGAACDSASGEPSYVLRALGRSSRDAESSLRFSLGRYTIEADIDYAADRVKTEVGRLRSLSPAAGVESVTFAPSEHQRLALGEAGSEAVGAWVRFHLLLESDSVKDARSQVYGCPHTVAVTRWVSEQLPGGSLEELRVRLPGTGPLNWAQALAVPAEKLGRLLIIEDALRAALKEAIKSP